MIRSRVKSVEFYVPEKVWKNEDLLELMETSDEWIQQRTGIKQRYWVGRETTTTDLALQAALKAIESAQIKKEEIDCILFATVSPDHEFPGAGCFFQAKLDLPGIPAIDVRQQCSGFLYGLSIADQFIRSGMYKKILLIGAEVHSKGLNKTTEGRDLAVLFGDGAGAMVLEAVKVKDKENDSYIYSTHLHSNGHFAKELWVPAPGMAYPTRISPELLEQGLQFPIMNGKAVFVNAVKMMPIAIQEALEFNNLKKEDIDLFIFHQANIRINEAVAKQLSIPEEKVFNTIQDYGNTTAATIPIGLTEAVRQGKLKKGDLVASAAFGSGFTWASAIMRW